jgi:signal transduction histidine kinase
METSLGRDLAVNGRGASRLAWGIAVTSFVMVAVSIVLLWLDRSAMPILHAPKASDVLPAITLGALGGLVASRRPRNPIGWLFLVIALGTALEGILNQIAVRGLVTGTPPTGWVRWPAGGGANVGTIGLVALILVLFLFPDGKPLNTRWRVVVWISAALSFTFFISINLDPSPVRLVPGFPKIENPFGIEAMRGLANSPLFLAIVLGLLLGMISLILRLRRSRGDERQQMKWFVYATALSVGAVLLAIPLASLSQGLSDLLFSAAFSLGFALALPGAAAVAILRYGLYDIDVVISKTILYLTLAAVITVIYVSIVVGIGAAMGASGNHVLPIIAATVIAVAFQPARDRSRRFANRLVYGKRATPYEVLSEFSSRIGGSYSLDEVMPRTALLLAEGTGATEAHVWLRVGPELVAAGSWPAEAIRDPVPIDGNGSPEIAGTSAVAGVRHQGDLLGALSIRKATNDPVTPADESLLADVASQAGLVLRNVALVQDLRASRQRLVSAQDEERRKLERNIHDGAQQQLVALAIKIRLADSLTEPEGRSKPILEQLGVDARDALEDLRDLARGIYPPLLADKGLVAALEAQARKSPVAVTVGSTDIGRFPQEIEAAVYFCVLEGLQNIAKYAQARTALVRVSRNATDLRFEVTDDGRGFDQAATGYGTGLQGIADRLSALDGSLDVRSAPGEGTTLAGTVPVPD